MRRITFFVRLLLFLLSIEGALAFDWPMKPFGKQHQINSIMGEYRVKTGPDLYFHQGVDVKPKSGDPSDSTWLVYSLDSDTLFYTDGDGVYVRQYWYMHLTNRPPDSTQITAFVDTIGRVDPGLSHLHFHWTSSYPPVVDSVFNPLWPSGLAPYVDSTKPHVDSIIPYQQAGQTALGDTLKGKIDFACVAGDTRTDTIGHAPTIPGNMSVYRIGYEVKDDLGNSKKLYWEKIRFDTIPDPKPDTIVKLAYAPGSTESKFRYWVTNDPFNPDLSKGDWYWNTKQKGGQPYDSVDAASEQEAKFPRGNYWVKLSAYDIRGDSACDSIKVYVDNFGPRVKSVSPADKATEVPLGSNIEVWFDEPMAQRGDLKSLITLSPATSVAWEWVDSVTVNGTPNPSLEPGMKYTVTVHDGLTDVAGLALDGDSNGIPGADYDWQFSTGDSIFGWRVPYQWDGARGAPYDSADLEWSTYLGYYLEFQFPFCGDEHTDVFATESGSIWFDSPDNTFLYDLPSANGHSYGVLAVHNDNIAIPSMGDFRGKLYAKKKANPDRVVIEWWFRNWRTSDTTNFEAVLFKDGWVRYDYKTQQIEDFYSDGGSGISCGDSIHYVDISPVYDVAPASYLFGPDIPPARLDTFGTKQIASLGLVWTPNTEADLKGYYLYRAPGTDTASLSRLVDTVLTDTLYVDLSVDSCSTYCWAASAVDTFWFEGALSNVVVGVVPPVPGASASGTTYNNGRKVVKDPSESRFYATYASADSVFLTWTDCEGCLWSVPLAVGGGKLPSIDIDDDNTPWIVWVSGLDDIVLYSKFDGVGYTSAETLYDSHGEYQFTSSSFATDTFGYGNVLVDGNNAGTVPVTYETFLMRFDCHEEPLQASVFYPRRIDWNDIFYRDAHSSVDCDAAGNLHVVWDEYDIIRYRKGTASGDSVTWGDISYLSDETSQLQSQFPCVEFADGDIYVVWQGGGSPDFYQILYRTKAVTDSGWSLTERVDTSAASSRWPVIAGGWWVVWVEGDSPSDIFYAERKDSGWTDALPVRTTNLDSKFPQAVSHGTGANRRMLVCWTEELPGFSYAVENRYLQPQDLLPRQEGASQGAKISSVPRRFGLSQNMPNPFVATTRMAYMLPRSERAVIEIYNLAGQRITRLLDANVKPGTYVAVWSGTDEAGRHVGSGTYFARFIAGDFRQTRKMILVR
jgi:hypothetical protein